LLPAQIAIAQLPAAESSIINLQLSIDLSYKEYGASSTHEKMATGRLEKGAPIDSVNKLGVRLVTARAGSNLDLHMHGMMGQELIRVPF